MYNGFGGKVEADETPLEAAKRELHEEAGIHAPLEQCGILLFHDPSTTFMHLVYIFRANTWQGEPAEQVTAHRRDTTLIVCSGQKR